jgi:hypothetical protein
MNAFCCKAAVLLCIGAFSAPCWSQVQKAQDTKPIVALVQRTKGRLTIKIEPDPTRGKDALYVFNRLREKYGADYPIVAIVDDSSTISDLYQVSGIAGKAGFERVRTFISHRDNGMMFEVNLGPSLPFSPTGPFDKAAQPSKQ